MTATPSTVRIVLQQCRRAKLEVNPSLELTDSMRYVSINRGVIMFIAFAKGAVLNTVIKAAKQAMNVRLSTPEISNGLRKKVSVCEGGLDVLIVPQASLYGYVKGGKAMQYHNNMSPDEGLILYNAFIEECRHMLSAATAGDGGNVKSGTYGNTQVMELTNDGPFTHVIDV